MSLRRKTTVYPLPSLERFFNPLDKKCPWCGERLDFEDDAPEYFRICCSSKYGRVFHCRYCHVTFQVYDILLTHGRL